MEEGKRLEVVRLLRRRGPAASVQRAKTDAAQRLA